MEQDSGKGLEIIDREACRKQIYLEVWRLRCSGELSADELKLLGDVLDNLYTLSRKSPDVADSLDYKDSITSLAFTEYFLDYEKFSSETASLSGLTKEIANNLFNLIKDGVLPYCELYGMSLLCKRLQKEDYSFSELHHAFGERAVQELKEIRSRTAKQVVKLTA